MSRPPGATVGGQAVLEGVMMRAPSAWAVAVRRPDGVIETKSSELPRLSERSSAARYPVIRGVLVLIESLTLGFSALSWSAQKSGDEDGEVTKAQAIWTMVFAGLFAIGLFIVVPVFAAGFLKRFVGDSSIGFVFIDGAIRIALVVGYVYLIAQVKEIQRVFQYHGAEHKTIHAYEHGDPLTVENIQVYSPRHPRCGTSFLLIVAMVAFVVFLALAPVAFIWQALARILLIPLIAGLSYEVLKAGANWRWMAWANRPGMWLQSVTTQEPADDMVEVAVASLLAALTDEQRRELESRGPIAPGALEAVIEGGGSLGPVDDGVAGDEQQLGLEDG